jgi:hypothetical protein
MLSFKSEGYVAMTPISFFADFHWENQIGIPMFNEPNVAIELHGIVLSAVYSMDQMPSKRSE